MDAQVFCMQVINIKHKNIIMNIEKELEIIAPKKNKNQRKSKTFSGGIHWYQDRIEGDKKVNTLHDLIGKKFKKTDKKNI